VLAFGQAEPLVKYIISMTKEGAMRRWLRLLAATTAIAVAAGIATAVGAFAQEESPSGAQEKVTFTVGSTNDAITFNPMFMIETPEYNTADLLYDKLLSWSQEDFSTVPDLATDWEQSDDGLTWTFTIRDDATWHDGTPLTARDIAFTFNWIIGEGAGNLLSYFPFTEAGDITAPDDTTGRPRRQRARRLTRRTSTCCLNPSSASTRTRPTSGHGRASRTRSVPDRSSSSSGGAVTSGAWKPTPTTTAAHRTSMSSSFASSRTKTR
jgi:hypothetical protein